MSFFDFHFTSKSENPLNKGFFKKFTPYEESSLENLLSVFSCPIIYWKKNGTSVSAISKIIDAKFVIFKVFIKNLHFHTIYLERKAEKIP